MQVSFAKRALDDGPHCGDAGGHWQAGGRTILCINDGLGHGKGAEVAASAALDYVSVHLQDSLPDIFAGCESAIRHTRGVAMGIAVIDQDAGTLTYAGVGNTRGIIAGQEVRRLNSDPGIVGGGYKTLLPEIVPLVPGDLVILSTDGVAEMMDMSGYDSAVLREVEPLAWKLLEDWGKARDDAAVLVFKNLQR